MVKFTSLAKSSNNVFTERYISILPLLPRPHKKVKLGRQRLQNDIVCTFSKMVIFLFFGVSETMNTKPVFCAIIKELKCTVGYVGCHLNYKITQPAYYMRSLSKLLLRQGNFGYSTNLIYHYNVVCNCRIYFTQHNDFTTTKNGKKRLSGSALVVVGVRIQVNHVGNIKG